MKESTDILEEILNAMNSSVISKKRKAPSNFDGDAIDYKDMKVAMLKRRLEERGLDLDGSKKEMLISRLEGAEKKQRQEFDRPSSIGYVREHINAMYDLIFSKRNFRLQEIIDLL